MLTRTLTSVTAREVWVEMKEREKERTARERQRKRDKAKEEVLENFRRDEPPVSRFELTLIITFP